MTVMKNITTDKGDIGVAMVIADLLKHGYSVFMPVSATSPFDLLAEENGIYLRIQVKYRTMKNDVICAQAYTATVTTKRNNARVNLDFDVLAIYCPETDKCYFLRRDEFQNTITLRTIAPKNNQKTNINIADDYLLRSRSLTVKAAGS